MEVRCGVTLYGGTAGKGKSVSGGGFARRSMVAADGQVAADVRRLDLESMTQTASSPRRLRIKLARVYGNNPRFSLASATRSMPRVRAASRRLNFIFRFWYSTLVFALSRTAWSFAITSSRVQ